jgi:hypothetical protein
MIENHVSYIKRCGFKHVDRAFGYLLEQTSVEFSITGQRSVYSAERPVGRMSAFCVAKFVLFR